MDINAQRIHTVIYLLHVPTRTLSHQMPKAIKLLLAQRWRAVVPLAGTLAATAEVVISAEIVVAHCFQPGLVGFQINGERSVDSLACFWVAVKL